MEKKSCVKRESGICQRLPRINDDEPTEGELADHGRPGEFLPSRWKVFACRIFDHVMYLKHTVTHIVKK